jgi:uncharacterized membrane protein
MTVLNYVSLSVGIIGVTVVAWGAFVCAIEFIKLEAKRLGGENICQKRNALRHHLGGYILLGLEFLIAADIINTVMKPTIKELVVLGSIVAIRTVLSFFLNLEMKDRHDCRGERT